MQRVPPRDVFLEKRGCILYHVVSPRPPRSRRCQQQAKPEPVPTGVADPSPQTGGLRAPGKTWLSLFRVCSIYQLIDAAALLSNADAETRWCLRVPRETCSPGASTTSCTSTMELHRDGTGWEESPPGFVLWAACPLDEMCFPRLGPA